MKFWIFSEIEYGLSGGRRGFLRKSLLFNAILIELILATLSGERGILASLTFISNYEFNSLTFT